ncbi:DUF305 domain-containing protein [Euzebya tangerina]|uniref:DUF305 domain-containing protein n=1 Tax=Euzebya tangerina TaxID=591198 RepID=UPI000E31B341
MSYGRFAAMIATSTVVMLGLMYLNTYQASHVEWSETRAWMALLMGATMAVIMLGFMWRSYNSTTVNVTIVIAAIAVFTASLFLVRSQITINDTNWMKAMIPHHSIAILTSERAGIQDVRVQELATEIIQAQRREIAEMQWLIDDIATNGAATTGEDAASRPVPDFATESD